MLPHRSVVSSALSLARFLDVHQVKLDHRDIYLSFLPLAHVFDRQPGRSCPAAVLGGLKPACSCVGLCIQEHSRRGSHTEPKGGAGAAVCCRCLEYAALMLHPYCTCIPCSLAVLALGSLAPPFCCCSGLIGHACVQVPRTLGPTCSGSPVRRPLLVSARPPRRCSCTWTSCAVHCQPTNACVRCPCSSHPFLHNPSPAGLRRSCSCTWAAPLATGAETSRGSWRTLVRLFVNQLTSLLMSGVSTLRETSSGSWRTLVHCCFAILSMSAYPTCVAGPPHTAGCAPRNSPHVSHSLAPHSALPAPAGRGAGSDPRSPQRSAPEWPFTAAHSLLPHRRRAAAHPLLRRAPGV